MPPTTCFGGGHGPLLIKVLIGFMGSSFLQTFSVFFITIGLAIAIGSQPTTADELDVEVARIFRSKCAMCHDALGEDAAAGDVGFLLQFDKLIEDQIYIDTESPDDSYLLEIVPDTMPKSRMRDIKGNGPLSEQELASFQKWMARGGPSAEYLKQISQTSRPLIRHEDVTKSIVEDLQERTGHELRNSRYLTIDNLHNLSDIDSKQMSLFRAAIVKTLNSLSWEPDVVTAEPIDEHQTVYRIDLRQLGWTAEQWDMITQHYPYALKLRGGSATTIGKATSSELPFVRADWFTFMVTQPPLYHLLLDIPDHLEELEKRLLGRRNSRLENIRNGKAVRAGFGDSGVSVNNRMIERHPASSGGYWISYDFGTNTGTANLFDFPLGPKGTWKDARLAALEFDHDGGEVIFNLPNGFQAYGLFDAKGNRIDVGPTNIVHDDTMTGGAIINGVSCISCHDRGMKPENRRQLVSLDRIRSATSDNFRRFDEDTRLQIQELYPEGKVIADLMKSDRQRFSKARQNAGIPETSDEPVRALFNQFIADLNVASVAAELGMEQSELERQLNSDSETRMTLSRLSDEGIKRQLFMGDYKKIVRLTGIGNVIPSKPLDVPFFGAASSGDTEDKWIQTQAQTGIHLIDHDHLSGNLQVQLATAGKQRHFVDGEELKIELNANEDCYVSLFSVDSTGDVTLLVPNQWHPQGLPVKANRKTQFPTAAMNFSFFARPPHGKTLLKAIATAKPLPLVGAESSRFQQHPLINFGNTKDLRTTRPAIEKAIGVRGKNSGEEPTGQRFDLTRDSPEAFLPLKSWGSARWTVTTHPK